MSSIIHMLLVYIQRSEEDKERKEKGRRIAKHENRKETEESVGTNSHISKLFRYQ